MVPQTVVIPATEEEAPASLPDVASGAKECTDSKSADSEGLAFKSNRQSVMGIELQVDTDVECDTASKIADATLEVAFEEPESILQKGIVFVKNRSQV